MSVASAPCRNSGADAGAANGVSNCRVNPPKTNPVDRVIPGLSPECFSFHFRFALHPLLD
jgi:hypothetical protein